MKLLLITGFLGSGKTTFLNKLLKKSEGAKIGIIINEFGSAGIDGKLIKGTNENLIELNNGSIFCSCIKENFIKSMIEMGFFNLDYLLIEASGLADPSNIEETVSFLNKNSKISYEYEGAICILDSLYFFEQLDMLTAVERQIKYSRSIIINKIDLQSEENINLIEEKIAQINPNAQLYKSNYCNVDIDKILKNSEKFYLGFEDTTNREENRPKSLVLESKVQVTFNEFVEFIGGLKKSTHRIKGFVNTDKGLYYASGVNDCVDILKWTESQEETRIVVISSIGIKIISEVVNLQKKKFGEIIFKII